MKSAVKRMRMRGMVISACAIAALSWGSLYTTAATAQDYPNKPVRMISPFSAGGGGDTVGRFFAQKLSSALKQQVIVDDHPGAGNIIATDLVAKAAPDGYTILLVNDTHVINASFGQKLPYDSVKDFSPISQLASSPYLMVVHPSLPVKSVQDMIKLAMAQPGQLNFGSSGIGTAAHLSMALFNMMAKVNIVHIPYRGISTALLDLAAGRVQIMIVSPSSANPLIVSHKLRAVASTGAQRFASMPSLPTVQESGVPGYEFSSTYGLLAPANTPRARIMVLDTAIIGLFKEPDVIAWLKDASADAAGNTPEAYEKSLLDRIAMYTKLGQALKLHID